MSAPQYPAIHASLKKDRLGGMVAGLLQAGCVTGGAVSVVGLLGAWSWVFDVGSHFQAQYFGFQLLCGVPFLLLKQWRWALVAGVFLSLPAFKLVPYYVPQPTASAGTQPLRVLSFNVLSSNTRHADTLAWVRQTDPDLALFPEVTAAWEAALEPLRATMPYRTVHPQEDNFGLAVFSKHPILEQEFIASRLVPVVMVRIVLAVAGRRVVFFGVHPLPPMSPAIAADRDAVLRELADRVRRESGPVIVAGDFNATPWSFAMRPLIAAGLRDTQLGRGFSATWQRGNPIFAIPIDHLLLGGNVTATARWTGPDLGSDHRPVVAELRF
jgi:endonuclease/exonuclease/phosphatase (EEP) superfamily protein YafD